jgi:hypothetical protein
MRPKQEVSIADGFWTSLAITGPLLAMGAFPILPGGVHRAALFLAAALGLVAMVRPFVRWPAKVTSRRGPSQKALRRMNVLESQG